MFHFAPNLANGKRKEQGGYKEKEEKCEQGQNNYKVLILKNNF